ncbi:MAG: hypothetical protein WCF22_18920 [Candidatus Sulfotelmatobacter sp.]
MTRFTALLALLVLALAVCSFATASQNSNNQASHSKTTANSAAANRSAKKAKTEHAKQSTAKNVLAQPENLSGTISMISGKEVTLMGSNGVPYDFDLTGKTRIEASNQKLTPNELDREMHKQATVHFLPTAQGNMAETIQISAS